MICIKNGTIHTAVDPQPFTGDILIGGGKILKIASHIDDDYEQLIEAAGLNIYPGFVEAHCHTGLDGYGNGVPGQDTNEWNDPVVPQLRAIDGINPMDPCFEMAAKAGITCFATGPGSSDAIGGTFAAVKPMGKRIDKIIPEEFNPTQFFCHSIKAFNQLSHFSRSTGTVYFRSEIAFCYDPSCFDQML